MGRRKKSAEEKRGIISIKIPVDLFEKMQQLDIKNRSKFFSWLLEEHFNAIDVNNR